MHSTIKRLNHLLGEIEGLYHDISLKLGLCDSISKILYTLCIYESRCPLSQLSRQNGLSKQTVHSAIRTLEEQGLVFSEPADGRGKDILLTEKGNAFARQTAARIIEMENRIFESWTPEEAQQYLHLTEKYLAALQVERKAL